MIEEGLFFDIGLQGFERFFHDGPAKFLFILWAKICIPHGIDDLIPGDDPVGPDHEGDGNDGTDVSGRDPGPFELFGQRCTATRAGASRGCEDDPRYFLLF